MTTEHIKRVEASVSLLNTGWREKIEYTVAVAYHQPQCEVAASTSCDCPVNDEKRSKYVHSVGLLQQLREYAKHADLGAEPKAERGTPGKSKSRPPASMAGFFLLDEIVAEAYTLTDRVMCEAGRSAEVVPIKEVLSQLPYQCKQIVEDYPHLVREVAEAAERWVERAQRTLGIRTSEGTFKDTVCGDCGGALAVGRDLARNASVRCIGTPSAPPCGRRYPMSEWMALYEKGRRVANAS